MQKALRACAGRSGPGIGKIARPLALEFGKIIPDHADIEPGEDRASGLAVQQETKRRLDATLRRRPQPLARRPIHGDAMTAFPIGLADDHLELGGIVMALSANINHGPAPK